MSEVPLQTRPDMGKARFLRCFAKPLMRLLFLMQEVDRGLSMLTRERSFIIHVQGFLAHRKMPTLLGPPQEPS